MKVTTFRVVALSFAFLLLCCTYSNAAEKDAGEKATTAPVAPRNDVVPFADLHSHTTFSDGSDKPMELVKKAYEKGLKVLAITDHDQLSYDSEAEKWAQEHGLKIIRGVEISCEWSFQFPDIAGKKESKIHLLGYFTSDKPTTPLYKMLENLRNSRNNRNELILEKLRSRGVSITIGEVRMEAGLDPKDSSKEDVVGRPHIARVLIKKGVVKDLPTAFKEYLSDEALELPKWSLDMLDSIKAIDEVGGIPVLAHPITLGISSQALHKELKFLLDIQQIPLKGLEVYSSRHDAPHAEQYLQIAKDLQLLVTGGSDYHGINKKNVDLGVMGGAHSQWVAVCKQALHRLEKAYMHLLQAIRFQNDVLTIGSKFLGFIIIATFVYSAYRLFNPNQKYTGILGCIQPFIQRNPICIFFFQPSSHSHLYTTSSHSSSLSTSSLDLDDSSPSSSSSSSLQLSAIETIVISTFLFLMSAINTITSPFQYLFSFVITYIKQNIDMLRFAFCFFGLQISYVLWGLFQERIMTVAYGAQYERFENAEFVVLANRIVSIFIGFTAIAALRCKRKYRKIQKQKLRKLQQENNNNHNSNVELAVADDDDSNSNSNTKTVEGKPLLTSSSSDQSSKSSSSVSISVISVTSSDSSKTNNTINDDDDDDDDNNNDDHLTILQSVLKAPLYAYSVCSFSNVISSWLQNEALKFVSFPLQVMSKSCKILSTMLMGRLLSGKQYQWNEYMVALMTAVGLVIWRMAEKASSSLDHAHDSNHTDSEIVFWFGVFLLAGYIFADSFTSNWQSEIFKKYHISSLEMMVGVNLCSSVLSLGVILLSGEVLVILSFIQRHPEILLHISYMSMFSATGQLFIYYTIQCYGAVTFATFMTARQFFSVMLSISSYGHDVSMNGFLGLSLIFFALFFKTWQEFAKSKSKLKNNNRRGNNNNNNNNNNNTNTNTHNNQSSSN